MGKSWKKQVEARQGEVQSCGEGYARNAPKTGDLAQSFTLNF